MSSANRRERTIAREAAVRGVSFLSGLDVEVRFRPAEAGSGVVFARRDLPGCPGVPAGIEWVVPRQRRTTVQRGEAVVEMVEHVMAALAGLRIDNCVVEVDGPETPGLDGSSLGFVEALEAAGSVEQDRTREVLAVERPVTVRDGASVLGAYPGDGPGLVLSYHLDYGETPIGRQSRLCALAPETFRAELASSRTFLLAAEAEALRRAGIGRRSTEKDLLIFGPDGPIDNAVRYPDECVRHKILDMVGDLALLGRDLAGHVVAHRTGHQHNAELVRGLLAAGAGGASRAALDIAGILGLLPHRYPFLLIDRVLEIEGDRRVVALKNVTMNEPFFSGHWPERPVMPGVLILEAMAQAGGVLVAQSVDARANHLMLASIDGAKLRRPVEPGDQLRLEAECGRLRGRLADVRATARVDGRLVAEARVRFVIVPKEQAA